MTRQILGQGEPLDPVRDLSQGIPGVADDVHGPHEGAHAQPGAVACAARGRQDMGRASRLVAVADGRGIADEDGTSIVDPGSYLSGVAGLDLQVLGGVGVSHINRLVEVTHQ